ncbi:MAG: class I SAM-dependent methyltransferase [Gammaproteobacteria bacterium]|nr:class I SAM-dependent methyltransferase [Gammaproteobacteria bacterium]
MSAPQYADASVRNSAPILGVLRDELKDCRRLLEIGTGTGHHAVTFAAALPAISWQTSDLEESHMWIKSSIDAAGISNVLPPLIVDVRDTTLPGESYDAVYSANTAHIMSFAAVQKMFPLIGHVLENYGLFCYYGPFKRNGQFSTPSNAGFDASLRSRDANMGIRDLETLDELAVSAKLQRQRVYAMPANNLLVVWQKTN